MTTVLPTALKQYADEAAWLLLIRAPRLGPGRITTILETFHTPLEFIQANRKQQAATGVAAATLDYLQAPEWERVEQDLQWLQQPENALVPLTDDRYPLLLRDIADPPAALFVRGDSSHLSRLQLAIVGSRNPTATGRETAQEFARYLTGAGLVVTSGLAAGIDGAAHSGALATGGPTIAVVGTGLDRVYPAEHHELAHRIADQGALVSEFPLGTQPFPGNFPKRNRLISGMSLGTLVVEATPRSGSLITARLAGEQGREVFAIPGSIHNPQARGCHALIRQGAKLVETAADIIEELGPLAGFSPESAATSTSGGTRHELDSDYQTLLEHLDFSPTSIDTLVDRSGLTVETVSSMLLLLELQGYVSSAAGGLYTRAGAESRLLAD